MGFNTLFCIRHFSKTNQKNKKTMQKLKQFLHWFFIKNHDFFGFKISTVFWMVFHWKWLPKVGHFQWKNHPKNKTFSEPLKNRFFYVLGALRDSARWPYWFFFHVFPDFWPKMDAKRAPKKVPLLGVAGPGTHQNRICDATSTFHRFPIDFGSHFHWFLLLLGTILERFLFSYMSKGLGITLVAAAPNYPQTRICDATSITF